MKTLQVILAALYCNDRAVILTDQLRLLAYQAPRLHQRLTLDLQPLVALCFAFKMQLSRTGDKIVTCGRSNPRLAFKPVHVFTSCNTYAHTRTRGQASTQQRYHSTYSSRGQHQQRSSSICRATVAAAEPGKTTLGFCGIGIMGLPMVRALAGLL